MNALEGARRMQLAGRWIVFIAVSFILLIWAGIMLGNLLPSSHSSANAGLFELIAVFILLACPGAALWLTGWIVEGFAKD